MLRTTCRHALLSSRWFSEWALSTAKRQITNYRRHRRMRCPPPGETLGVSPGRPSGLASSADGAADKVMDDFVHCETADYKSQEASLDAMPAARGNPWRFPRAAKWTKVMDDFVHVKIRSHGTDGLRSPCRQASRSRLACHASRWRWRPWWPRSCTDRSSCRRLPASG